MVVVGAGPSARNVAPPAPAIATFAAPACLRAVMREYAGATLYSPPPHDRHRARRVRVSYTRGHGHVVPPHISRNVAARLVYFERYDGQHDGEELMGGGDGAAQRRLKQRGSVPAWIERRVACAWPREVYGRHARGMRLGER